MSILKILFIGLGGAGQRQLRIFRQLLPESTIFSTCRHTGFTPLLKSDFSVNDQNTVESEYNLQTFANLESAFASGPDLTVISTPTAYHRKPMFQALESGSGVFVEKPWAENLQNFAEFKDGILAKHLPFHISFQRRFHQQIVRTREALKSHLIGNPIAASFTVYSNVPSWHIYEDWKTLYAVKRDLGGGVLLTEIHEIDLANWFFGLPDSVFCSGGNRSSEKLEVEDTVQMTLLYSSFSVQITLCFMHKKPKRFFNILGTKGEIYWDGDMNKLAITPFLGNPEIHTEENYQNDFMFLSQAKRFLTNWTFEDTIESLKAASCSLAIVEAARKSMISGNVERVDQSFKN